MIVEKGSASKTIKNVGMEMEKLLKQTSNTMQKASTLWTDNGQKLFFQKHINEFYNVQREMVQNLNSIAFEIQHLETKLKSK